MRYWSYTMHPAAALAPKGLISSNRVLIVDDYEDAAEVMKYALERMGYDVRTATDGPSALETALTFKPCIALLDVGLPVMDGYELAMRLRAAQSTSHDLHLVAVTGHGADSVRSAAAGFEGHLLKPVELHSLEQMVRKVGR
ncbi:MAG TPA: response regulator [Polyangiaceae bacterium]|nr:response regulator [Polyangiaceae bacterium]